MSMHYTLFSTRIGRCGLAWSDAGLVMICLPEAHDFIVEERLARRGARPQTAPQTVATVVERLQATLDGRRDSLLDVALDMRGVPAFHASVYETVRRIPWGETRSYGEVARHLLKPGAARAVGQAMARNPFPLVVPCHRVLAQGQRMGGFTAHGGCDTKMRLLEIEGCAQTLVRP
jgi:methylated-DNA-[protein]-cysteine S-methyltransferase